MLTKITFILILFLSFSTVAQDGSDKHLADYYYNKGELDKAQEYYQKIYKLDQSKFIFTRLYACLLETNNDKEAEKLLKKQIAQNRADYELQVMLGQYYEDHQDPEKAAKVYKEMIDNLDGNPSSVVNTYNSFKNKAKYDLAIQTLDKGRKTIKNYPLNFYYAELYGLLGDSEKMINEYLDLVEEFPHYQETVLQQMARQIDFSSEDSKEYELVKIKLLEKIQKKPGESAYSEMLIWLFLQKSNFNGALVQAQALDKREGSMGGRVMDLGRIALENKNYTVARKAFQYVVDLGPDKPLFYAAESSLLNSRFKEVTTQRNYTNVEINEAISDYSKTIDRLGYNNRSQALIIERAHIRAFYGNQGATSIEELKKLLATSGLTEIQKAQAKMELADILVLYGDIWDASLYYMQVQKAYEFEIIGQEAKYKNARIFYFDGEFDFAQSQLDVLKQSTSKLISNDAMELSLLITDNFGLDSNYTAMTWFANADLLIEQHRYEEAYVLYDSIILKFPYHSLADEIEIRKARAQEQQGNWSAAIPFYEKVLKYHNKDILADDAVYGLAIIYQDHLGNNEKALEYLRKLLFEFPGSLYVIEARKRLRNLRGDGQEELWEN